MAIHFKAIKPLVLTDYIATRIIAGLHDSSLIEQVGPMCSDLDRGGWLISPAKTVFVKDMNGKDYKITVEEYNA